MPWGAITGTAISLCYNFYPKYIVYAFVLTLAGVWDRSVLTELEEEQWDPVFVSVPDKRRFLDSGELDICTSTSKDRNNKLIYSATSHIPITNLYQIIYTREHEKKL